VATIVIVIGSVAAAHCTGGGGIPQRAGIFAGRVLLLATVP
jgi:hypothetical protein